MIHYPKLCLFSREGRFFLFYGIDFPDDLLYNKYIR